MSAFAEFILVAIALYLWESTLWLPLRATALRKRWLGNGWKALNPGNLVATREVGLVTMLPLLTDSGLAPCQGAPLLVDSKGVLSLSGATGEIKILGKIDWDEVKEEQLHLVVGDSRTRISSPRCVEGLRKAKVRGDALESAVRQAMRFSISPVRAGREWKRWRLVSGPLQMYGWILTIGVFGGLPWFYVKMGNLSTLMLAGWLWCVMAFTACHLWWLGKRVYPGARSALRTDAWLSLLVPFHAMRAMEIASVHAMGTTHPAGLILSSGDFENPWLGRFIRKILHPRPGADGDELMSSVLRPLLDSALQRLGRSIGDFETVPDRSSDQEANTYCPRCHGLFLAGVKSCPDCRDIAVRPFVMEP
jgi:hypothetical protein